MPELTGHLTAEDVRQLIALSLVEYQSVAACRPVSTIYADRLGLAVEDRAGALWRVWIALEPLR